MSTQTVERGKSGIAAAMFLTVSAAFAGAVAADQPTSYAPVDIKEDFPTTLKRMEAAKPAIEQRQQKLLEERYDLGDRPAKGVSMSRGKPVQSGVRVRLPPGATWDSLSRLSPQDVRAKGLFPTGFMPLPHPNHPEGGMLFPQFH